MTELKRNKTDFQHAQKFETLSFQETRSGPVNSLTQYYFGVVRERRIFACKCR